MRFEPHDYQTYVINKLIEKPKLAVFLDMGLGKTACTLASIDYLMNDALAINKTLVISPLKVARLTWEEEIEKWDELSHIRLSKIVGTRAQRVRAIDTPSDVYIINRENTKWLLDYFREEKRPWPYQMIVIDESSSFKNRASERFKAAKVMTAITPRVVELTGTPTPNGLMDLWAQMYLLDQGARLGKTLTAYRERYFLPDKRSRTVVFSYKPRSGAKREIYNAIKDLVISMKAVDYVKMPERVDNTIKIAMPARIRALYEKMENDYLLTLDEETIVAASAGVVMNKLLQMANGAVYLSDKPGEWALIHDLKLKALEEIMEANEGKPVMVFYQYKHDLARLQEYFQGYEPRILEKDQDKKDWDEGRIRMLLAHPASMGHGLNLQAGGNIIVWFGMTWNLEHYQQANARLYRQGQNETVVINHLMMEGTEDETVLLRLVAKKAGQDELIEHVKARIEEAKRRSEK